MMMLKQVSASTAGRSLMTLAIWFFAMNASAATYVSDSFDAGLNGGTGWSGEWEGGFHSVQLDGLTYSDSNATSMDVLGGRFASSPIQQGTFSERGWDTSDVLAAGAETWVGFLIDGTNTWFKQVLPFGQQRAGAVTLNGLGFGFQPNSVSISTFNLGVPATYDASFGGINDGNNHWIVGRFRFFDGQDDEISLWVDPDLSGPIESAGNHVALNLNLSPATYDYFSVNKGSGGSDGFSIDEIRVGSDFASIAMPIIPEPATALLLGLGLAGFASRRDRV